MNFRQIISKINSLLNFKDKFLFWLVFSIFLVSALIELITISSLIPFLNLMMDPEIVYENYKYKYLIFSEEVFLKNPFVYITTLFVIVIIISTFIKFLVLKGIVKTTKIFGLRIASIVYKNIINQTYISYSKKNSSEYISALEVKVEILVGFIYRALQTLSSLLVITAVMTLFLLMDPILTIILAATFSFLYLVIYKLVKNRLYIIDKSVAKSLKERVKVVQESISIFRQVKLDNLSNYFRKLFHEKEIFVRSGKEKLDIIGNSPRIFIEGGAIVIIAIISYQLISKNIYDEKYIVTLIGTIVFGSSRILPLIQLVFYNISFMIGQKTSIIDVLNIITANSNIDNYNQHKVVFKQNIEFKNVSFGYEDNKNIIENLNLNIKKNSIIGIKGKTGSGKSTFVDLLSGLLVPDIGKITVDGFELKNSIQGWQKKISYIDQKTTLIDSTIAENIALGVNKNQINRELLEQVLLLSECSEFVNNFTNKYETYVGERGVRLSGGQIQRIGIARALYKNSEILILDEPTSSVDQNTENLIMKSIENLKDKKTIILISHRISTLEICQEIYELKDKSLIKV
tara:strand:+ start:1706 stop:3424 length:1719 start_codon:yes stop_codon:yes gene_type:complete